MWQSEFIDISSSPIQFSTVSCLFLADLIQKQRWQSSYQLWQVSVVCSCVEVFLLLLTDLKREITNRIKFKANNDTKYNNNLEADDEQAGLITRASSVSSTTYETPTTANFRKGRKKVVQTEDGLVVSIRRKSTPAVVNKNKRKKSLYDSSDDENTGRANVRQKPAGYLLVYL